MANTKQARKRARQAVARNQHLSAQRNWLWLATRPPLLKLS